MGKLINATELAEKLGVTKGAITQAVASKRISPPKQRKGQRGKFFDLAKASAEWAKNTNPTNQPAAAAKVATAAKKANQPTNELPAAPPNQSKDPEEPAGELDYFASRAKKEFWMAAMAKLEFEAASGTLVKTDEVRRRIYSVGREVRDQLLNIPARLSAELALIADPHEIQNKLNAEINQALKTLSERLAAGLDDAVKKSND